MHFTPVVLGEVGWEGMETQNARVGWMMQSSPAFRLLAHLHHLCINDTAFVVLAS